MLKSLIALAVFGVIVSPAAAQTAPQQQTPVTQPPIAPRPMIKKVVCERIDVEETTGSRLGSAPKKCRTIEVPAPANRDASNGVPLPPAERGN